MIKDYNNYDYLAVSVKSDQLNRILQCYRALGWEEIKTVDDRQYLDMKYVRLCRPHKIANKDRLQYLQVRMESAVNSLASTAHRAHIKSNLMCGLVALVAACLLAVSLWLIFATIQPIAVICGWCGMALSLVVAVAGVIVRAVMRRRERKVATGKIISILRLIQTLLEEAVTLAPLPENSALGAVTAFAPTEVSNG